MNSSIQQVQDMQEKQRIRNKKRLINQNKKLNTEIRKLRTDINEIIGNRDQQQNDGSDSINRDQNMKKFRQQLTVQESYLRKLKNKIDFLKSANVKGNAQYVIKQEDDLKILKKQYQNLLFEKQTVIKFKQDKLKQLQKNQPFQEHKNKIETQLANIRAINRKMQADITQLQRQIRKYHNMQIMHKVVTRQKNGNTEDVEYELAKAKHQLSQIHKKTRQIEQNWKPQYSTLDNMYFELKNTYLMKQKKLTQLQKQYKMWETRKNGLREQQQVMEFRERLSKINTNQWKVPQASTVIKRKPRQTLQNYLIHGQFKSQLKNKQQVDNSHHDKNQMQSIKQQNQKQDNNKFSQVNTLDEKTLLKGRKQATSKKDEIVDGQSSSNLKSNKPNKSKQKPEQIVMLSAKKKQSQRTDNKMKNGEMSSKKIQKKQDNKKDDKSKKNTNNNSPQKLQKSPNKDAPKIAKTDTKSRNQVKSERGIAKDKNTKIQKQKSDKNLAKPNQNKDKAKPKTQKETPNKKNTKMILKNIGVGTG